MQALVLLLFLLFLPGKPVDVVSAASPPLTVTVTNLKNTEAAVYLAVYKSRQDFGNSEGLFKSARLNPNGKTSVIFSLPDLEFGVYAVGVYQDINGNGKLDTGFFGIPKEPYGFSNNFRPVFSGPTFDNCKFQYTSANHTISITLLW
ncbi:MAG TPA: DUF2141 domain-containing protein [Chitinophagales bacterium]|nr:DUF2141 domain-containing protein [Chitinophagales bacterium]HRK28116.1 DUF2141 domain-containing protein [Chitinophagales bacterium]